MLEMPGTPQVEQYHHPLQKCPQTGSSEWASGKQVLPAAQPIPSTELLRFKLGYSRQEAAAILGISLRTLDRLIAEKQLSVRRVGRRVLVTRDVLAQFFKRGHQTGAVQ